MGCQETRANPTAREMSRITVSSQRRPSRAANRSDGTADESAETLASTSEAVRWLLVIAMKLVRRSLRKRKGNCEVTVYVPAGDRRNSFDPANYLLIKASWTATVRPRTNLCGHAAELGTIETANCKARRVRTEFRARQASFISERPSFLQSRRHPSARSPVRRLLRE